MKRTATVVSTLGLLSIFAGGCATSISAPGPGVDTVSLTVLGPVVEPDAPVEQGVFVLGAGDALGQTLFTHYVALVRAQRLDQLNQQAIVSGETATGVAPLGRE